MELREDFLEETNAEYYCFINYVDFESIESLFSQGYT